VKNIIIVIVVLILVGGGILVYQNWRLPKQETGEEELYIKVISPNGGEIWKTGEVYEIQWEAKNPDKAPYEICLIKLPQLTSPVCFYTIVDDHPGDKNSYLWQIPDATEIMGGGEYLIRVIAKNGAKLSWFSDESNTPFTIVLSPSEIAGWKTYRNDKAGFEIKYPSKDWGIISESDTYILIGNVPVEEFPPHSGFTVKINNQALDDYISSYEDMAGCKLGPPPETESIKIVDEFMLGEINATKLEACSDHFGTNIDIIFVRKNSKSYIIQPIPGDTIHDQMLSTFRFLE